MSEAVLETTSLATAKQALVNLYAQLEETLQRRTAEARTERAARIAAEAEREAARAAIHEIAAEMARVGDFRRERDEAVARLDQLTTVVLAFCAAKGGTVEESDALDDMLGVLETLGKSAELRSGAVR